MTSICSLIPPLQFSFLIASYQTETEKFQYQAQCATCVYDQDTAAPPLLHGDSQPLPHYWLDFLGPVLEQMQASCTRRRRPGWIWIFVGAGPQGAEARVAANGSQRGALRASPICVPVQCHDLGMQLLLRQLPAGHSNCRCVFFYLFIYVNRVQSLK